MPSCVREMGFRSLMAGLALLGGQTAAEAQPIGEIRGRVVYSEDGRGIPGVMVFLPGLNLGRLSDDDGRFRIEGVPEGRHEIVTALLGCQLASRFAEVEAGESVDVRFQLSPPVMGVEGLVVTGVASERPLRDVPYAVARLDGRETDTSPGRSVGGLIQGKVAGAKVVQGSGQPGDQISILLRSARSILLDQDPLVVVDGVITDRRGLDIDPSDVESVEILKGAGASAIYGSRGQAGVIEITTKRGPAGRTAPRGPVVVVDGVMTNLTLADVNPAEIATIRKFEGAAGAVLYGPPGENGVIQITTHGAPPEAERPPFCVLPR